MTNKKKMGVLLIFIYLLNLPSSLKGQTQDKDPLIVQIDSLYRVIFTHNYTSQLDFPAFDKALDSIIDISEVQSNDKAYYKGVNVKFIHLKYQDKRDESRTLLDGVRAYALERQDSVYYGQFTYLIGNLFSRFENYDSALVYFEESLQLSRKIDDLQVQAASINAMAVTYANLDRDDMAKSYYYKSLRVAEDLGDSSQILTAIGNLATVYSRMQMGDSAVYYAKLAFQGAEREKEPAIRWHALNSLTIGSFLLEKYSEAIGYADQLRDEVTPIEELGFLITSHLYRSKSLAALGKLEDAFHYAEESLVLARAYEVKTNELRALEWLVELTEERNDFKRAFEFERQRGVLQDSLNRIEANQRIDRLAIQYETQEKEDEIAALNLLQEETQARQRIQRWFLGSLIALLVLLLIYLSNIFKNRLQKEKLAKQKARNELLRTQLNPHFLFNALSSIQLFLIDKGQGSHALNYLSKFAKLMRRILENSRRDFVVLDAEVSTLRHYLDLQKIRFDNRFEYRIDLETQDDSSEIMIPPMFAQPFIENSLEHGVANVENGLIEISFKQEGDILRFKVEDNGIGLSKSASLNRSDNHEPLATKITQDRIDLLKKQLKRNISFIVKEKKNDTQQIIGTEVIFNLPIQFTG